MNDTLGRPLRNLRLSVTDRCNLRCEYCMPDDDYVWLPREDVLHFEETSALVDAFLSLGVDKVRLTGGEPLLRRDVPALVRMLSVKPGLRDLALTTNGVLLADQIDALRDAGLGRITVSLDTLRRERFLKLTRFDQLDAVREGIAAASTAPFGATCDRGGLPADGMWYLCLYATRGLDLRAPLRQGASPDELRALITGGWQRRDDRGAEDRLALGDRRAFVPVQDLLKKYPDLESHTRQGELDLAG